MGKLGLFFFLDLYCYNFCFFFLSKSQMNNHLALPYNCVIIVFENLFFIYYTCKNSSINIFNYYYYYYIVEPS